MAGKIKKLTEKGVCVLCVSACICARVCVDKTTVVWPLAEMPDHHILKQILRKKLTEKQAHRCIANTQLPHCACQRVHGRIGKGCM